MSDTTLIAELRHMADDVEKYGEPQQSGRTEVATLRQAAATIERQQRELAELRVVARTAEANCDASYANAINAGTDLAELKARIGAVADEAAQYAAELARGYERPQQYAGEVLEEWAGKIREALAMEERDGD